MLKKHLDISLENHSEDKPFFLASHSQGSLHAQRLLTEKEFKAVFKATHHSIFNWISIRGTISQNLAASVCTRFLDEGIIIRFQTVGENVTRSRLKFWMFDGKQYSLQRINQLAQQIRYLSQNLKDG